MHRRNVLVAGLGAVLASAATAAAQTKPASGIGMDAYVQETLLVGSLSLAAAQIAAEKATDDNVRRFAALEIAEQQTIAGVLASVASEKTASAISPDQQEELDRLAALPAGRDFDLAFIESQIKGHDQLLRVQQSASGNTEATVEAITARLAEQGVQSHIAMLGLIQQMIASVEIQNIQDGKNPDGTTQPTGSAPPATPATGG